MMKKGQAAMEFLMTYGWAILVVLVAIGALAYFGVLSPEKFLPENCQGQPGFECIDKASIDGYSALFIVKNNLGYTINISGYSLEESQCSDAKLYNGTGTAQQSVEIGPGKTGILLKNGEQKTLNLSGCSNSGRFKSTIKFNYKNLQTMLPHSTKVDIVGKVS